jgi:hypothetical protein
MGALKPGQLKTDADGATSGPPVPEPGRYEIDVSCSAVTFSTRHLFGLALAARYFDLTMEVRCVRT